MDQTLHCILLARRDKAEFKRIIVCLSKESPCEIIVDRHRLQFDPSSRMVAIRRASEDVPFACKIIGCRVPYETLRRLLDGDFSNMEGYERL